MLSITDSAVICKPLTDITLLSPYCNGLLFKISMPGIWTFPYWPGPVCLLGQVYRRMTTGYFDRDLGSSMMRARYRVRVDTPKLRSASVPQAEVSLSRPERIVFHFPFHSVHIFQPRPVLRPLRFSWLGPGRPFLFLDLLLIGPSFFYFCLNLVSGSGVPFRGRLDFAKL